MADETISNLIDEMNKEKYHTKSANKLRKTISKVLVLNELEESKALGIRKNIKTIFNFLNSSEFAQIPVFDSKEEFQKCLDDTPKREKILLAIAALPIGILSIPFIAIKMGVKTGELIRLMLNKKELVEDLKAKGLYDNIVEYAKRDKEMYSSLNSQEYMDHIAAPGNNDHNDLIDEMDRELNEKGRIS